jgi:hypothetical protein
MRATILAFCLVITGCATSPETLSSVAKTEAARLAAPTQRLSTFAGYELKPMVLGEAVTMDRAKVEEAAVLERALKARIQPLIDQWTATGGTDRAGTLVIEPHLASLRVVSGGARFWAGAFAGDSSIDMDLLLTDQASGQVVSKPRITRSADAMTGAWSIGQSDDNLLDYITAITYQYLVDSY